MLTYRNLTQSDYNALRYQVLLNVEETGDPKEIAYRDSKGIPTIGIGFISDTEGRDTIVLAAATGLGAGGLSVVNTGDQGQYRQLNVALDNSETLKLDDAFFGASAAIQFANGDEMDLETLVGETLLTPVNITNGDNGGRVYGGGGE